MKAVFPCSLSSQIQCFVLALLRFKRKVFSFLVSRAQISGSSALGKLGNKLQHLLFSCDLTVSKRVKKKCYKLWAAYAITYMHAKTKGWTFLPPSSPSHSSFFFCCKCSFLMTSKYILLLCAIFNVQTFLPFTYAITLYPASAPHFVSLGHLFLLKSLLFLLQLQ